MKRTTKLIWYDPEQREAIKKIRKLRGLPSENAAIREALDDYIAVHLPSDSIANDDESTITNDGTNDDDSDTEDRHAA